MTTATTERLTAAQRAESQAEAALLDEARTALTDEAWIVGKCASIWCSRYARGRTDEDFGSMLGLSRGQVSSRRRVWDRFGGSRTERVNLDWSHYYAALSWSDATECLDWAEDNQATVSEMKCWRRLQHGDEILFDEVEPEPTDVESADQSALSPPEADLVPTSMSAPKPSQDRVRDVTPESELSHAEPVTSTMATLAEADPAEPYAPFRSGAAAPAKSPTGPSKPSADNGDGASRDAVVTRRACNAVDQAIRKTDDSKAFVVEVLAACFRFAPGDTETAIREFSKSNHICGER